jgi:hypothetical protein
MSRPGLGEHRPILQQKTPEQSFLRSETNVIKLFTSAIDESLPQAVAYIINL